jgi:N-acetylglucosamine kinase-like BadF-type ATPase
MMSYDYRGEPTSMMEPILRHFGVTSPPELPPVIYDDPDMAMREIAQLSKIAVRAAEEGDQVARDILKDAAKELAVAAIAVIEQLRMDRDKFHVAYVGGVFEAGELILGPLREEIQAFAPRAEISAPIDPPVIGAAKMARAMRSM